jgi:ribosome biogenesis GTP-binding protein YsxC/EngB
VPRDSASPFRPPEVRDAVFVAEARDARSLPPPGPAEIAIAGRSNVGKSTLLNRLANRRGLARTSRTPGRTRGIVLFQLALGKGAPVDTLRLCDLPGYGYAKVSRTERDSWQPLIEGYTRGRPTLALFVVLVDARRGIEDEERQLYEWLGSENVPAQIVFTKVDKLSASERGLLRERTRQMFGGGKAGGRRAAALLVSAETGEGVPELWAAILSAAAIVAPALAEGPGSA